MVQACSRCGATPAADARFCSGCGSPLTPSTGAERRLVTVFFADVVGSTELAVGRDPEDLQATLARFFAVARAVLEQHGGTVQKYVGDAVMAVFGVPRAHGDDPDRAVAAALALLDEVAALEEPLALRIGVNTGEVLTLRGGGDLAVSGEAIHAAARLQQGAAPGQVLVGERTARACRLAALRGPRRVSGKGFTSPLVAWEAHTPTTAPLSDQTELVGRRDELDLLGILYRRVLRQRSPKLVTVVGEAGVGKSRLLREFRAILGAGPDPPQVLIGRNPPYGRGVTFWALGEIIRGAAGVGPAEPPPAVQAALTARLRGLGAVDASAAAGWLAAALGLPSGPDVDAPGLRDPDEEVDRAWRLLCALLARERPLVLALEDMHSADQRLLELVEGLTQSLSEAPVLVLCTARPDLLERRPDWGGDARHAILFELGPLIVEEAESLVHQLLPAAAPELARRVAEATAGNPFFAEEMTRQLAQRPAPGGSETLPDSVQATIAARLDLLPEAAKQALERASVLGETFAEPALAALSGQPVGPALEQLARRGLLVERAAEAPGSYGFPHALIREVAYAGLPRGVRADLHERAGDWLASPAGEAHSELAELVAVHRRRAASLGPSPERAQRAAAAGLAAAELALRRGAAERAQALLEDAARAVGSDAAAARAWLAAAEVAGGRFRGDEAIRLYRAAGEAAERAGEPEGAAEAYARAIEIATRFRASMAAPPAPSELEALLARGLRFAGPEAPARGRLLAAQAWLDQREGKTPAAQRAATEAVGLARRLADPLLLSAALEAAAEVAAGEGRLGDSARLTRERVELLPGLPPASRMSTVEETAILMSAAYTSIRIGSFREGRAFAGELLAAWRARHVADTPEAVAAVSGRSAWLVTASFFLGEWDEALEAARRMRAGWVRAGRFPAPYMASAGAAAGAILGCRGEERRAREWFAFARQMYGAAAGTERNPFAPTLRADVELHHGRAAAAADRLAPAPARVAAGRRSLYGATRAEAFVRAGRPDAEGAIREAEACLDEDRYSHAVALRGRGLLEQDEDRLRRARSLFLELGSRYQAARTGLLLDGQERGEAEHVYAELGLQVVLSRT